MSSSDPRFSSRSMLRRSSSRPVGGGMFGMVSQATLLRKVIYDTSRLAVPRPDLRRDKSDTVLFMVADRRQGSFRIGPAASIQPVTRGLHTCGDWEGSGTFVKRLERLRAGLLIA